MSPPESQMKRFHVCSTELREPRGSAGNDPPGATLECAQLSTEYFTVIHRRLESCDQYFHYQYGDSYHATEPGTP
jgi:hypothetical protein